MSKVNALSKGVVGTTFAYLVMLFVGFFPQRWLRADIVLPVNGSYLTKTRPIEVFALAPMGTREVFNSTSFDFNIRSEMGLYTNCKDSIGHVVGNILTDYTCDGEGAADWQKLAFCTAVGGLLFGTVCLVMSIMAAFKERYQDNISFRFVIVCINFLTAFLALCTVIMYISNRKIQVKPPLPTVVTFDIGWALFLTLGGAAVASLVFLLNTYLITVLGKTQDSDGYGGGKRFKMDNMSNGNGEVAHF